MARILPVGYLLRDGGLEYLPSSQLAVDPYLAGALIAVRQDKAEYHSRCLVNPHRDDADIIRQLYYAGRPEADGDWSQGHLDELAYQDLGKLIRPDLPHTNPQLAAKQAELLSHVMRHYLDDELSVILFDALAPESGPSSRGDADGIAMDVARRLAVLGQDWSRPPLFAEARGRQRSVVCRLWRPGHRGCRPRMLAARVLDQLWLVMVLRVRASPDHLAWMAKGICYRRGIRTLRNMALSCSRTWHCRRHSRSHWTCHVDTGIPDSTASCLGRIVGDRLDRSGLCTYLGGASGLARDILF